MPGWVVFDMHGLGSATCGITIVMFVQSETLDLAAHIAVRQSPFGYEVQHTYS